MASIKKNPIWCIPTVRQEQASFEDAMGVLGCVFRDLTHGDWVSSWVAVGVLVIAELITGTLYLLMITIDFGTSALAV